MLPSSLARAEPSVVLLSLDGTRHDYPERVATPAFDRIEREGARGRLVPVFPPNTFPSHVSLATGAHPARHGIVGNVFLDPERGLYRYEKDASWIEAEPIWVAAERQGVRAATFFWVGSETDWNGIGASRRQTPFDGEIVEATKVDQILEWIDLPDAERPRLILSWWRGCDSVGHDEGPDAPEVAVELAGQDRELGRLLAGLDARGAWEETTLLVLSDHGMATARRPLDATTPLARAGIGARAVPAGGAAFVFLDEPGRLDEAIAAYAGDPHVRAYPSHALPPGLRAGHPTRAGHLTLLTEPPYFFSSRRVPLVLRWLARLTHWKRGMHGYAPDRPDMQTIFYAKGRGVAPGTRLDPVRAIDVAPTVARLLGIDPPAHAEGAPRSLR